jgi:hypothetical protein
MKMKMLFSSAPMTTSFWIAMTMTATDFILVQTMRPTQLRYFWISGKQLYADTEFIQMIKWLDSYSVRAFS